MSSTAPKTLENDERVTKATEEKRPKSADSPKRQGDKLQHAVDAAAERRKEDAGPR